MLDLTAKRAFWLSFLGLLAMRFGFAAATVQYHIDGDNTVSLLQANDWLHTPQRSYFWGQDYMGTTEVWLFSGLWRLAFGESTIPLLYWVFCAQLLFSLGAALVMCGLVFTDKAFWGRAHVFAISAVVFGFGVPVFQKYTFGIGHGYSAGPLYAGIAIACYLARERMHWALFALAGLLFGQSHFIFRLHLVYPIALAATLVLAGPRQNMVRTVALVAGTALGMLPEKFFQPAQGYAVGSTICLSNPANGFRNAWLSITQGAMHFGTMPNSLIESEHALWFAGHRALPEGWVYWGEWAGAFLFVALLGIDLGRLARSRTYAIFSAILLVNIGVLFASCFSADSFGARRYLHPSLFSIAYLIVSPSWTFLHWVAISLRTGAFAAYAFSALMFTTPLAVFRDKSALMSFDETRDCLLGSGGDLSATMAFNDLRVRTIDLDWRLRDNYSKNVAATREDVKKHCRQVFWIDSRGRPASDIKPLCKLDKRPYYEASAEGLVEYPQRVRFYRCRPR